MIHGSSHYQEELSWGRMASAYIMFIKPFLQSVILQSSKTAIRSRLCGSRKYPYSTPPTEGIGIPLAGGGFCKAKKEMYKAQLEFPEGLGGEGLRKNPFHGGGMDIFWNYTIQLSFPFLAMV